MSGEEEDEVKKKEKGEEEVWMYIRKGDKREAMDEGRRGDGNE